MTNFDELKKAIRSNVKGAHVSVLSESDIAINRYWVETPALDLNRILSGSLFKGIQSRNLLGLVGPEHSMKSSLMVLCMAAAQKQGKKPVIIDTEGGVNDEFCRRWGLDPTNALYVYTPWTHEVKSVIAQIKDSGDEGYVIGIDSVGGLDRYKSQVDALAGEPKADQGLLQKEIRGILKLLLNICIGQNSIGIVNGHYYGMPSTVPMPDQIGGGKAMKLFPSILVTLKKGVIHETSAKESPVIGNKITATTLKNRIYPPYQTATIILDYKNGLNEFGGIMELAIEAGLVKQSGSWYSYGEERLGQGILNAMEGLKKIPDIKEKLDKWLETTGYSKVNTEVKEAIEIIEKEEIKAETAKAEKKITIRTKKQK